MRTGRNRRTQSEESRSGQKQPAARLRCHSRRTILLMVFLSTVLTGCESKQEAPPGLPDVEVTEVVQRDVPVYTEWVAPLNGPNNAQITPRVQGYLLRQDYR